MGIGRQDRKRGNLWGWEKGVGSCKDRENEKQITPNRKGGEKTKKGGNNIVPEIVLWMGGSRGSEEGAWSHCGRRTRERGNREDKLRVKGSELRLKET